MRRNQITTKTYTIMKEQKYYVWATDKIFSGWGCAENKICKRIWICDTWEQAEEIYRNVSRSYSDEYKYINYGSQLPRFSSSRYVVCEHKASECPLLHDRIDSAFA